LVSIKELYYDARPNKSQENKSQSLFYLTTTLHVWGVTITHLQEHKRIVTTAFGNHYTLLLTAVIVEELELIWVIVTPKKCREVIR